MASKKKSKKTIIRNPYAVAEQSGSGFHSPKKYGKKDRKQAKQELKEYYG